MAKYTPQRGDYVSYYFGNRTGHEQQGRRPALVLSNDEFNTLTGVAFVCPITTKDRDYPFHIPIPLGGKITGVVMVDQLKAIDFEDRKVKFLGTCPPILLEQVLGVTHRIID